MPDPSTAESRFGGLVKALVGRDGVTLGSGKRGFGSDARQVDCRIFAMLRRDSLILELPPERVQALLASGTDRPSTPAKAWQMKDWIVLEHTDATRTLVVGR